MTKNTIPEEEMQAINKAAKGLKAEAEAEFPGDVDLQKMALAHKAAVYKVRCEEKDSTLCQ